MKKPEWKKELDSAVAGAKNEATTSLNSHKNTANIHRAIYISTVSPTNTDGKNGDVWIVYES